MKRTLIAAAAGAVGAAGAISAAGLFAAAPASAQPPVGCTPEFVCEVVSQPGTFVEDLASQPGTFLNSINPATLTNQFVVGDCTLNTDGNCEEDGTFTGIVNQPQQFVTNLAAQPRVFATDLASQPGQFLDSINPVTNLQTFVGSITDPFNAVEPPE